MKLKINLCFKRLYSNFISHTVQMKPGVKSTGWPCPDHFISHTVQMKHRRRLECVSFHVALYPTRFRWNIKPAALLIKKGITLYPTRFRWNSLERDSPLVERNRFISHTVQMKRAMLTFVFTLLSYLYIPHGSDETRNHHSWYYIVYQWFCQGGTPRKWR